MKKIILTILGIFLMTGCSFSASILPTKAVEDLLGKYQAYDTDISSQLRDVVTNQNLTDVEKTKYEALMKKQYQNLTYNIKKVKLNGDSAIVTTEIEVFNYNKTKETVEAYLEDNPDKFETAEGKFSNEKYVDYKIDELSKVNDRVKYTLELNVKKVDNKWQVASLSDTDRSMINGVYKSA